MGSIEIRDPELEESFSFSSYDFKSSLAFFSDQDDDHTDGNGSDSDGSFIEIALESRPTSTHVVGGDDGLELRILAVSFPEFEFCNPNLAETQALEILETETPSSSSTTTTNFTWSCSSSAGSTPAVSKLSNVKRRAQFPAINRVVNTLLPSSKASASASENDREKQNWELLRTRKASKFTTAMNGGFTKFLIKFRSLNIRSLLTSLAKARQVQSPSPGTNNAHKKQRSEDYYQRLVKPLEKFLIQKNLLRGNGNGNGSISNNKNNFENCEKSRVLEINFDAVRGVVEAMTRRVGCRDKKAKSCPSSIKSSPIHKEFPVESKCVYARENSIQAAIAHCKRSSSQLPDFCF